ncbi:MAG: amidoligase family protein [Myxococcota bacterium]
MTSPLPSHPDLRAGFELELLAPSGRGRHALAQALARRVGGAVRYGFKYISEGTTPEDRPICHLTPAYRVLDAQGGVHVTLVDDITIREQLEASAPPGEHGYRVVMDDLRLALWLERVAWVEEPRLELMLRSVVETFNVTLPPRPLDEGRHVVRDPFGNTVCVVEPTGGERERVCEVVTRPLTRAERRAVLTEILDVAKDLGFVAPVEAALHVHLDRAPWMETRRLTQLIVDHSVLRPMLITEWQPNPRCRLLGPFPPHVLRVAEEAPGDLPFAELCAALDLAGATKSSDINILGVIRPYPKQPTLEVRSLPMTLDADSLLESVARVERFLDESARTADQRAQ